MLFVFSGNVKWVGRKVIFVQIGQLVITGQTSCKIYSEISLDSCLISILLFSYWVGSYQTLNIDPLWWKLLIINCFMTDQPWPDPKIIISRPVVVNRSDAKIISLSQRQKNIFSSFLVVPVTRPPRSPPRHASRLEISEIDKVYNLFSKFCPEVRDAQNYTCALVRHLREKWWVTSSHCRV